VVGECGGWSFLRGFGDFSDGSEVAEMEVVGDLFDWGLDGWVDLGGVAREVGGRDLETVEEDAGALVFDVAGGETAEDLE
jgi:hypothetical protein